MGEAQRRGVHGGIVGPGVIRLFVKAWFAAGDNERIEFTDGQVGTEWVVVATVGAFVGAMTPDQAREAAAAFEATIGADGTEMLLQPVSDVVVALRAAADEVERLHPLAESPSVYGD